MGNSLLACAVKSEIGWGLGDVFSLGTRYVVREKAQSQIDFELLDDGGYVIAVQRFNGSIWSGENDVVRSQFGAPCRGNGTTISYQIGVCTIGRNHRGEG
jgi:hypothetical protein